MAASSLMQPSDMVRHDQGRLAWYTFRAFDGLAWLRHGFTTRLGGASDPPFHSLNLGLHVGDSPALVLQNRGQVFSCLGINPTKLVAGEQVHGLQVSAVGLADTGRGAQSLSEVLPGVDAVITDTPGVPLVSFYADCVPIFLVDTRVRAVGVAHAGWKGTLGRIGARAVLSMAETFGSKSEDLLVGVGPHIGRCCFRVGDDLVSLFRHEFPRLDGLLHYSGASGHHLDLAVCIAHQLGEVGCRATALSSANMCTACNTDIFFSHRAEKGRTGRMAATIQIME